MKHKFPFAFYTFPVISFLLFAFNKNHYSVVTKTDNNIKDSAKSHLAMYGAYIFTRENCSSCHTLIQHSEKDIVSLDGLSGKYPFSWHFHHLMNPQSMVPISTMPSYEYLAERQIERDSLFKNLPNASEEVWRQLLNEAQEMKVALSADHVTLNARSEIIALIAFLNSIPETEELQSIRKIENERIAIENRIKDSIWQNSESLILSTASDKNNIKAGAYLFSNYCTPCHATNGEGFIGPNLTDNYWLHGGTTLKIAETIKNGVPDKGMPSWKYEFTPTQIGQIVAYIHSIKDSKPKNAKMRQGTKE
jgi:mono/diheme cytochrome c family protein